MIEKIIKKIRLNLKSNKGISMMSLLVYVVAFLMVAGIVSVVTTFFYNNYKLLDESNSYSSEYNKLNLCLVEESKARDNQIYKMGNEGYFSAFKKYNPPAGNGYGNSFFLTKDEYDYITRNFR